MVLPTLDTCIVMIFSCSFSTHVCPEHAVAAKAGREVFSLQESLVGSRMLVAASRNAGQEKELAVSKDCEFNELESCQGFGESR